MGRKVWVKIFYVGKQVFVELHTLAVNVILLAATARIPAAINRYPVCGAGSC